jgi:hypothetical protein
MPVAKACRGCGRPCVRLQRDGYYHRMRWDCRLCSAKCRKRVNRGLVVDVDDMWHPFSIITGLFSAEIRKSHMRSAGEISFPKPKGHS